jgi:hypothetical protein
MDRAMLLTGTTAIDHQEKDGGSSLQEAFTCQQQPAPNRARPAAKPTCEVSSGAKPIAQSN